jgi:hypothetical protein
MRDQVHQEYPCQHPDTADGFGIFLRQLSVRERSHDLPDDAEGGLHQVHEILSGNITSAELTITISDVAGLSQPPSDEVLQVPAYVQGQRAQ